MGATNALLLQEELKKLEYVTIPWLQKNYSMSYPEARSFLQQLQNRGWVATETEDIRFAVRPEHLCLRKIRRSEVDGLIEDITSDCILALTYLDKQEGAGATYQELERAVHGEEDTDSALDILLRHRLVYCADELYFLQVSKQTVSVLWNVEAEKRKSVIRRKMDDSKEKEEEIRKLFDVLFEEE